MSSASALHQTVDQYVCPRLFSCFNTDRSTRLLASSSDPLQLLKHRETFQERALRDVTVNSNDSAMMLDPNNPLLVKEEMEAQKVGILLVKVLFVDRAQLVV